MRFVTILALLCVSAFAAKAIVMDTNAEFPHAVKTLSNSLTELAYSLLKEKDLPPSDRVTLEDELYAIEAPVIVSEHRYRIPGKR